MIRAPWGDQKYWDGRFDRFDTVIKEDFIRFKQPSKNPGYRPQFTFDTAFYCFRLICIRYSRGDAIGELSQYFNGLLDAWELSNKLANELNATLEPGQGWDHRHILTAAQASEDSRSHGDPRAWVFSLENLNHYNWCFWLVGLALLLEIDDALWKQLLRLVGGEGEDALLDRVIAAKEKDRKIGTTLLHEKPYARLLKAVDAPQEEQATLLKVFVDNWYNELNRKGNEELWWYIYGDPDKHPLSQGSYFGRWCIEAAVCAKVFGLDDSLCRSHEYYPEALVHNKNQSAPSVVAQPHSWFSNLFGIK